VERRGDEGSGTTDFHRDERERRGLGTSWQGEKQGPYIK
jgi:hypothetical protein